eukprot:Trichotokara_eunicae@DN5781_c0_g1_i1.p2
MKVGLFLSTKVSMFGWASDSLTSYVGICMAVSVLGYVASVTRIIASGEKTESTLDCCMPLLLPPKPTKMNKLMALLSLVLSNIIMLVIMTCNAGVFSAAILGLYFGCIS